MKQIFRYNYENFQRRESMRSPKGFGKNYFTFSAVLAYNVAHRLQSQTSALSCFLQSKVSDEDDEIDENDPPSDALETLCSLNAKPCHCNCFYKLKTRLTLLLNHYIPRCPYYTTYFAFRRTGVHPPQLSF